MTRLLGRFVPGLAQALDAVKIGSVSLPIALGLLVMMYPVLAKVRYDETHRVTADKRLMTLSLARGLDRPGRVLRPGWP